ncbi:helix-turn-helix domain-containing protein [Actinomyces oris]|uniref:helix-turn-helix domain-containing protein n=1 Tax=Actinomyces oris TaxID=544580 RepID=UPI0028E4AF8F|nr:helix-turn-helix domain-containing protein [Actinomyces oris]
MSKLMGLLIVALSLPHSKQWEACWRYVMGVVDLAVVPTGRGSSLAEDPGSSLDVASRADTKQGNRTSASANAADADSVEEPGQEDDADSPAAKTVAEKHERDEDPSVLSSSATMAGAETSGQNGELGTPAEATTATQQAAGSTTPTSHQTADGAAVRTPAPATTSSTTPPRRINRYLRPQLVEEMVVLHQAGQAVAQIAARFGFHRTTVARHLKQAGETLRTNPADPAFQERVWQAYAELGTVKHTAQRLGVSKDTVRKVVRGE